MKIGNLLEDYDKFVDHPGENAPRSIIGQDFAGEALELLNDGGVFNHGEQCFPGSQDHLEELDS